ncbi:MAG: hypothetical protein N3A58_00955 [Spirochaetes bacterium]|nr:hypothetical protein [Spirochaetota bacterium]
MSFFSEFFKSLFKTQPSSEIILKRIGKEILKDSPKYYNTKKEIIFKTFAKDLYFLKNELSYFREPLEHLFSNKSAKEVVVKNFLKDLLDKDTLTYYNLLEIESVNKVLEKYGLEKTKLYYDKLFKIINEKITNIIINQVDKLINEFKSFYDIVEFNFISILSLFDAKLISNVDPKYSPNFSDIKVSEKFKELLADLNFLNINFNPDENFDIFMQKYLSRYYALKGEKFSNNYYRKKIKNIFEVLKVRFNPMKFEKYLQFMYKSIEYKSKIVNLEERLSKFIIDEKIKKVKEHIEKIEKDNKLKDIDKSIKALFNKVDIITSNFYNETYSNIFLSTGLKNLEFVKPYSIIKTFTIVFYEGKYKNILLNIIYKAIFLDDNLNTGINQSIHNLNDSINKINKFEEEASILEKTYNQILKKPEVYNKNKTIINLANQEILEINNKCLALIKEIFNNYFYINKILLEIINDYKQKKNLRIKNLTSSFDDNFIGEIINFSKTIGLLDKIIKEIVPIQITEEIE